jgi:hypothetical protein
MRCLSKKAKPYFLYGISRYSSVATTQPASLEKPYKPFSAYHVRRRLADPSSSGAVLTRTWRAPGDVAKHHHAPFRYATISQAGRVWPQGWLLGYSIRHSEPGSDVASPASSSLGLDAGRPRDPQPRARRQGSGHVGSQHAL